jgi:hypothetical protein
MLWLLHYLTLGDKTMLCIEIESREDGYAVVRVSDRYGFIKAYAGWNGFAAYELLNEENLDVRGRT